MHEVTNHDLMIFVILGFFSGIFVSVYLTRLIEVVHMWRIVKEVIIHLLLMCVTIMEDVEFLKEVKKKQMKEAKFDSTQIQHFQEVEERTLTNWKNSVIQAILTKAPQRFRSLMPFNNWAGAVKFLENSLSPTHSSPPKER